MSNRVKLTLISVCVVGVLAFFGVQVFRPRSTRSYTPDAAFTERARLAEFASNGVRVVLFMDSDGRGLPLLRATFTPTDHGFHLYSKDLDLQKTGGLGMATRLELLPHPSVKSSGPVFSDVSAQSLRVEELNASMDIYPDGAVSLRLPIEFVGDDTSAAARVSVSYMACRTNGTCLRPVERHILDVQIPRLQLAADKIR